MAEWKFNSATSWPRHQVEVSGQPHTLADFFLAYNSSTHWKGRCVGPKGGLDFLRKKSFSPAVIQTQDHPVRRLVLDWLSFTG